MVLTKPVNEIKYCFSQPRGPVIGPLVICGAMIQESDIHKLKAIGAKDSKLLTQKQRLALCMKIKEVIEDFKIIIVQPAEIDKAVDSKETNLNWLEADKNAEKLSRKERREKRCRSR